MREIPSVFQDVDDPRRGNAKRHDPHEALTIALLSMLTGGRRASTWRTTGASANRGCGSS